MINFFGLSRLMRLELMALMRYMGVILLILKLILSLRSKKLCFWVKIYWKFIRVRLRVLQCLQG